MLFFLLTPVFRQQSTSIQNDKLAEGGYGRETPKGDAQLSHQVFLRFNRAFPTRV